MKLNIFLLVVGLQILLNSHLMGFDLKNGDLIFQESCSGDKTSNAIKNVTKSSDNYRFTHVGIIYIPDNDSNIYVIDATPPKVRIVSINKFLEKDSQDECIPISVIGRINAVYQHCIPSAIKEAKKLIGKEYDYGFIMDNDKYYCSELIYHIFLKANKGMPVFDLNVMTFKQKNSEEFDKNWIQYFKEIKLDIPEGKMGINPGAMSLSNNIQILGQLKNREQRNNSSNIIRGLLTDSLGRCVHYSSEKDIVANQCYKCKRYYGCYKCHDLCENHDFLPWPVDANGNSEDKAVLCGNCFYELSINEYKQQYACTQCKKQFNPKCVLHSSIYFKKSSIR